MLMSLNGLRGTRVRAKDGEIGHVEEFLFDDERWVVRYVVVDTGGLMGQLVLMSPIAVTGADRTQRLIDVAHTKEQIRNSPAAEHHRPLSRQYEQSYFNYFGFTPYWVGTDYWGPGPSPAALAARGAFPVVAEPPAAMSDGGASHVHSTKDVTGYHIQTTDGEIGHVDDFLADEETWAIQFLRVDTSNWIGGKAVLIPRASLRDVNWETMRVEVALSREEVQHSPEYDSARTSERGRLTM